MTIWRHKKTGRDYEVITDTASLQFSSNRAFEEEFGDEHWTVYRCVRMAAIFVRPTEEFFDGRFVRLEEEES